MIDKWRVTIHRQEIEQAEMNLRHAQELAFLAEELGYKAPSWHTRVAAFQARLTAAHEAAAEAEA